MITVLFFIILGVNILGILKELFGAKGTISGFIGSIIATGITSAALYFGGMAMFIIGIIMAVFFGFGSIINFWMSFSGKLRPFFWFVYNTSMLVLMIIGLVHFWGTF